MMKNMNSTAVAIHSDFPNDFSQDDPEGGISLSFARKPKAEKLPAAKEGYLMKKSPNLMTGWQKRYFVLKEPGDISYYENVRLL